MIRNKEELYEALPDLDKRAFDSDVETINYLIDALITRIEKLEDL